MRLSMRTKIVVLDHFSKRDESTVDFKVWTMTNQPEPSTRGREHIIACTQMARIVDGGPLLLDFETQGVVVLGYRTG